MEDNQHNYIDKMFEMILSKCDETTHTNHFITRSVHPIPDAEGEDIHRFRVMDLIQYQMKTYVVIREARKDELADEITYHIIVYSFNLKNKRHEQVLDRQLNVSPIDSCISGFQCEKVSYYRQGHQIYFFIIDRDLEDMKDTISLHQFDLLMNKETVINQF